MGLQPQGPECLILMLGFGLTFLAQLSFACSFVFGLLRRFFVQRTSAVLRRIRGPNLCVSLIRIGLRSLRVSVDKYMSALSGSNGLKDYGP